MTKQIETKTVIHITMTPEELRALIAEEVAKVRLPSKEKYGEFVTRKEAAEILKRHTETVKKYERAGKIDRVDLPGRGVLYSYEQIKRLAVIKGN